MLHRSIRSRGNTLLEFALVVPLLIALILYSLLFNGLVRAKLKLQEVARYAAWEVTSQPLSDYGTGSPGKSFEVASGVAIRDAVARYAAADSAEPRSSDLLGRFEDLQLEITQTEVPWIETNALSELGGEGGGWSRAIFGALSSGPARVLQGWGFNILGQLRIQASAAWRHRLLPHQVLALRSGLTLIADGWTLPDGADSMMKGSRAGQHREGDHSSGLYRQVRRMGFLGIRAQLENVPAVRSVLGALHSVTPNPIGTYVVSHNYAPEPPGEYSRDCNAPGYPENARGGLNNLQKFSHLDSDRPRCFDTAPFRDQASYADSLYIQMFLARGRWFMGCKNAQADDPSSTEGTQVAGETSGESCE